MAEPLDLDVVLKDAEFCEFGKYEMEVIRTLVERVRELERPKMCRECRFWTKGAGDEPYGKCSKDVSMFQGMTPPRFSCHLHDPKETTKQET